MVQIFQILMVKVRVQLGIFRHFWCRSEEHGKKVLDVLGSERVLHKVTLQEMKNPFSEVPWIVGLG